MARDLQVVTKAFDPRETGLHLRYRRLRQVGEVEIILCECGRYYRCETPADPWGSRVRISLEEFAAILDRAEREVRRPCTRDGGRAPVRVAYA